MFGVGVYHAWRPAPDSYHGCTRYAGKLCHVAMVAEKGEQVVVQCLWHKVYRLQVTTYDLQ